MTDSMTDPTASVETSAGPEVRSWGWHLLQLSAWVLVVMLPAHLAMTWLVHDSGTFGVAIFVDRWRSGPGRIFDWVFIVLALLHGGIGLNGVIGPLVGSARSRTAVAVVIAVGFGALGLAVSAVILRFVV